MNPLPLAPLPRETSGENNEFRRIGSETFIDEQTVWRVIALGAYGRTGRQPSDMALSACGDDYAGWMLPKESSFRGMVDAPMTPAPQRLPLSTPPWKKADNGTDSQGARRR